MLQSKLWCRPPAEDLLCSLKALWTDFADISSLSLSFCCCSTLEPLKEVDLSEAASKLDSPDEA